MPGYPVDYAQVPMPHKRSPEQEMPDTRPSQAVLYMVQLEKISVLTIDILPSATDRGRAPIIAIDVFLIACTPLSHHLTPS